MSTELCVKPTNAMKSLCLIDSTTIAGTRHVPGIMTLAKELEPGDDLAFAREARNVYDPWAIAVLDPSGRRLGYVSCECNEIVSRLLDGGRHVSGHVRDVAQIDSWTRIAMEVTLDD